jgi:hypothetical protein
MKPGSTASNRRNERWLVIALAALAAVLFYLFVSYGIFRIGFPLDDSWIHLTYARNLAEHGEWAFRLGQASAGSTSPFWTFLLSIGFLLELGPYIWTYLLGWLVLTVLAVYSDDIARRLVPSYNSRIPWAGLFFVFAWHLTWSAVSGMETLLHGLMALAVLGSLIGGSRHYLALGALVGLSIWVRPDGITLLGSVLFVAWLAEKSWRFRFVAIWKTLLGFGSLFSVYLLFNLALSGNPFPNTFYAKQAEYEAYWLSKTLLARFGEYLSPLLASPFLALLPGAIWWLAKRISMRDWTALASLLWFLGYVIIFFTRLPAYQHGRYIIPAFPVLYLWGMLGFLEITTSAPIHPRLAAIWRIAIVALTITFQIAGARQNAYDVFLIESEMVDTARWVQQNLPPDARLAVHDIGAIGYYVRNPLVDMAGLITPEVIPFIRDETRLADYLDANSVDFLIAFPSFYPQLSSRREVVHEAGSDPGPVRFIEHMRVFRWR